MVERRFDAEKDFMLINDTQLEKEVIGDISRVGKPYVAIRMRATYLTDTNQVNVNMTIYSGLGFSITELGNKTFTDRVESVYMNYSKRKNPLTKQGNRLLIHIVTEYMDIMIDGTYDSEKKRLFNDPFSNHIQWRNNPNDVLVLERFEVEFKKVDKRPVEKKSIKRKPESESADEDESN